MVSFDVKSLFTKVPIDDALHIIKERLEYDESLEERTTLTVHQICNLTELCLRSTYFKYEDVMYEQKDETAMGSPLSPVVANIFMEAFESTVITTSTKQPRVWYRYVDDTFVMWGYGKQHLREFLTHMNDLCERIQFTMEIEEHNKISFLDVLVERKDHYLSTSIIRKPTLTDRYLDYRSHHYPRTKTGIISCLRKRAEDICLEEEIRNQEFVRLEDVFSANGYPVSRVQAVLHTRTRPEEKNNDEESRTIHPRSK